MRDATIEVMILQEAGTAPDLEIHLEGDYAAVWGDLIFTDVEGDYHAFFNDTERLIRDQDELRRILRGARLRI